MVNAQEIFRLVSYVIVGVLPIVTIFFTLLLKLNIYPILLLSFFVSLVTAFIAFVYTTNPLSKIASGEEYGVITLASPGKINIYSAKVQNGKIVMFAEGKEISQKFNRNLFWYVSKKIRTGLLKENKEEEKTSVVFETVLDNENVSNEIFKTDYPFLVYSPTLNSFITKEWLFKREHDSMLLNLGWELKTSIDEHNKAAGGITRWILDLIAAKSKNPETQKLMLIIVAVVVGILVLVLFGPMVYEIMSTVLEDSDGVGGTFPNPTKLI